MRQGQCPFPCSLFLFPLAVHHLCFLSNLRLSNGKLLRIVRVLRISSKFCLLLDMIVDGSDHFDSHTHNIVLNLCFVVVDVVDPLCL